MIDRGPGRLCNQPEPHSKEADSLALKSFCCDTSVAVVQGNDRVILCNSLYIANHPFRGLQRGAGGWKS